MRRKEWILFVSFQQWLVVSTSPNFPFSTLHPAPYLVSDASSMFFKRHSIRQGCGFETRLFVVTGQQEFLLINSEGKNMHTTKGLSASHLLRTVFNFVHLLQVLCCCMLYVVEI